MPDPGRAAYIKSAQTPDGVSLALPMQPEPLPLEQPARLARPVQLQAVRKAIGIPGLPAFCGSQGGLVLDASVLQSRTKVDPKWLQGRANAAWRGAAVRLRLQSMLNPNAWKQAPQKLFGLSLRGNALIGRARSASATAPLAVQRAALTLNARVDISGRDFTLESPDQTDDVRVPGEQPQIAVGQWGKSRRVQFSRLPPMSGIATKALDNNTVLSTDVHINRTLAHATGWHKAPLLVQAKWANSQPGWLHWRLGANHAGHAHTDAEGNASTAHSSALEGKVVAAHSFSTRPRRTVLPVEAPIMPSSAVSDALSARPRPPSAPLERSSQDVSKSGIAPDELLATATAPVPGTQALAPIDTLRQHRSSSADFSPSADASISGGSDATVLPAMEAQAASSKGGKSTLTSAVAIAKGAMDGVTNAAKGTHAGELTRQVRQLTDTLREQRETLQRQRAGVRRGSLRRALQRWTTRKNRLPFYIKEPQGLLLDVQYGAAARLPVNARAAARRLSGRGGSSADASTSGNDVHAEAPTVLQSIVAPLRPLLQGVHVQPIARVRAAATIGKFRKFWLDHTSVAASLDMGLRHAAALGLPDYGPRAGERSGMHHLAALSLRQQIWGPVRACADVRWDLSTDGGRQGQPHADAKQPGPALGSRPLCHLANLQPERLDGVYGLEFMAGVASLLAWYCPVRKQGMVEIRA